MTIHQVATIAGNIITTGLNTPEAYIDPSTGGMLFQILAVMFAFFSGIIFFFSRQIRAGFAKIRRKIRGESQSDEDNEQNIEPPDDNTANE